MTLTIRDNSRQKTSLSLTRDTKYRLSSLKAELRHAGFATTESEIVEILVSAATVNVLKRHLRRDETKPNEQ